MGRKIGFGVRQWASVETLYAWTWVRSHFVKEANSCDDELFIIHISNGKENDRWSNGGPVLPELNIVMQQYRHTLVEIEGNNAGAALVEISGKVELDVLIVGVREKGAIRRSLGNTTDYIVHNSICPCLVIRPKTAVGDMYRLRTQMSGDLTPRELSVGGGGYDEVRRVAIAFDTLQTGQMLFKWAANTVIYRTDNIIAVRSCNQKLFKKARMCNKFEELSNEDDSIMAQELQGFNIIQEVELKGDPRSTLTTFAESEGIDLLIIARSSLHPLFKGLGGTNVSKALYHRSPCPCMVVPLAQQKNTTVQLATEQLIQETDFDEIQQRIILEQLQITSDESGDEVVQRQQVQMTNQGCQTESVMIDEFQNDGEGGPSILNSLPTEQAVEVHRTIENLNEKLRQKDALISELRSQLRDMQHKISNIMDEVANSSAQGSSAD